jgi:hypothetical protein
MIIIPSPNQAMASFLGQTRDETLIQVFFTFELINIPLYQIQDLD